MSDHIVWYWPCKDRAFLFIYFYLFIFPSWFPPPSSSLASDRSETSRATDIVGALLFISVLDIYLIWIAFHPPLSYFLLVKPTFLSSSLAWILMHGQLNAFFVSDSFILSSSPLFRFHSTNKIDKTRKANPNIIKFHKRDSAWWIGNGRRSILRISISSFFFVFGNNKTQSGSFLMEWKRVSTHINIHFSKMHHLCIGKLYISFSPIPFLHNWREISNINTENIIL